MDQNLHLWLIPLLPLIGAAINGLCGKRFPNKLVVAIALCLHRRSFAYALWWHLPVPALRNAAAHRALRHLDPGRQLHASISAFYLDQLSLIMMLVVTGVGFLIHIYSVGYMAHEGGYYRFFSYLNLFMFFMLTLVLANNYLLMFVGWEGVGLASYLLIGFFFRKNSAAQCRQEGVHHQPRWRFRVPARNVPAHPALGHAAVRRGLSRRFRAYRRRNIMPDCFTAIGICLLIGAYGKSAQIPLYVWLPDAMEGPTPVSALIHAATMVTAGVYMIARSNSIFSRAPHRHDWWSPCIGALTAIFAATIGMVQTDIKRVLAYSTISQLGYMFLACGVGAYYRRHLPPDDPRLLQGAALPLRRLGDPRARRRAGHAQHGWPAQDHPLDVLMMTVATFAIAGFPPLAGFFSKDEILWKVWSANRCDPIVGEGFNKILWLIGIITAGMTSFYMFRLWFMTFFGEYRGAKHAPKSRPTVTATRTHDDHGAWPRRAARVAR